MEGVINERGERTSNESGPRRVSWKIVLIARSASTVQMRVHLRFLMKKLK